MSHFSPRSFLIRTLGPRDASAIILRSRRAFLAVTFRPHSRAARSACALFASGFMTIATAVGAPAKLNYNEDIQPILAENCFSCHGPDSASRKGKLRLDRAEFATAKRDDRPAITPGNPKESAVVERILSTDPDEVMPPSDSHKQLKPGEIALLTRWIAEGAEYQPHWSLLAPRRPAVPAASAKFAGSVPNQIDAFVGAKLRSTGLRPNAVEAPARLLRRLTLDLTGLPPTPTELATFELDHSPAAYARTVDRLLTTAACAEHFARHWLDAVRYADTHGIHIDNYRTIWPYRDWVIGSFHRNLPFDQFTIEQIAGDLLPEPTLDQRVASGFNRCLPTTSEGGAIAAEYEAIYAKDRVDTLSTVWLGLTTGCAACHDHKFDAVSQRDFYALTAFFRNNTMPAMDGNVADTAPNLFIPAEEDRARWTRLQEEIIAARAALDSRDRAADPDFVQWLTTASVLAPPAGDRKLGSQLPLIAERPRAVPVSADSSGKTPPPSSEDILAVDGPYGPATLLNTTAFEVGPAISLLRGKAESFAFLIRIDGAPSGSLLACFEEGRKGPGWEILIENGKVGLHVADGNGRVDARGVATAALAPGSWHHVLLSFDAASMRSRTIEVFVDGKSVANSTVSAHLPVDIVPVAPLRLGSRQATPTQAATLLTGGNVWVQDLRLFHRGFLAGDIKPLADVVDTFAAWRSAPAQRTAAQKKLLRTHFLASEDGASLAYAKTLEQLLTEDDALRLRGGVTLVMEEKKDSEASANILIRGEYSQLGEKVAAATPSALPPLPAGAPRNRLALAQWLVAPEHPLTARVTVNRVWQQFFGTGLVESSGDFGVTGSRPSHPQLLDWLAVELRESGWDYRKLVRLIVTSATYRQSAAVSADTFEKDPANRLLARGPRYRLDAEQLRDQVLAASGLLVTKVGGRPVRPYQPEGVWEDVAMKESTTRFYRQDAGDDLYRRSIYTLIKRTAPAPAMDILNAPSREVSCVRRDRTNTPLQALVTLNEPLFVEASRQLAARVLREAPPAFDRRLDAVSLRLLGRKFTRSERGVVKRLHDDALALYRREPKSAEKLLATGASLTDSTLPLPDLAAWTLVASQVMNTDESLTK